MKKYLLLLLALTLMITACSKKHKPPHASLTRDSIVLALGDSLTAGYGASAEDAYPAQLAQLSGWHIINAGINGDTSGQALQRLPQLLNEYKPQLVIISIGGNDFLQHLPEIETRAYL
ncbi:MAG: GDSL-type esterase/lipase family protein, partial [Cardiobacteriaceae bacterium]|nr:GDSL-type esterase/lipase family protein [Cardiobacteriaceae bacterium]